MTRIDSATITLDVWDDTLGMRREVTFPVDLGNAFHYAMLFNIWRADDERIRLAAKDDGGRDGAVTFLTYAAAAKRLSVSERTVRRFVEQGRLPYIRVLGCLRIPESALDAIPWQYAPTATPKAGPAISLSSSNGGRESYADSIRARIAAMPSRSKPSSGAKSSPGRTSARRRKSA